MAGDLPRGWKMDDGRFEEHLPKDVGEVADALRAGRAVADGPLLERVLRKVEKTPRRARGRLRPSWVIVRVTGVLAAVGLVGSVATNFSLAQMVTSLASATSYTLTPPAAVTYCPNGTKANFRWHYIGQNSNGSFTSGSWSGTGGVTCPDDNVSLGPQAMEGDLKVAPGSTLKVGYDLTVPGLSSPVTINVTNPKVVFSNVHCASGATPTQSSFTVTMPDAIYHLTTTDWYPSGDQHSPLVYEGSILVPNLCPGGTDHRVRLDKGGTFSATVN